MRRRVLMSAAWIGVALAGVLLGSSEAAALCVTPAEAGSWKNSDPDTRSITRVDVEFRCNDVVLCPVGQGCLPLPPPFHVSLWGACHPTDCVWGRRAARQEGDWIRTEYDHGYAKRYVWIRAYPEWPGWLRVYVWTDFTAADGRTDYASDSWFVRR